MQDTDVIKVTKKDLDAKLIEAKDLGKTEGAEAYKQELIDKGFNPDNIGAEVKKALAQPTTVIGSAKEAKSFPLGFLAYATAEAKMNRMTVPEVIQKHINVTGDDTDARLALHTLHKTYSSQDGEKLKAFESDIKTIGMATLLDGIGSDGGYDLEIAELLRPESVLFQLQGAKNVSLQNGSYTKRINTDGIDAYWLGETEGATDNKGKYKEITLRAKRAGALTTISKASLNLSNKNLQQEAEQDLIAGLGELVDRAFFTGLGSSHQPLGLNNRTGFATHPATATATPIEVGNDLDSLKAKILAENIRLRNPYWLGTASQKIHYGSKYTANGQIMHYGVDLATKGILSGVPFLASNYVSTDDSVLWLIDVNELIIASGYGVMIDLDENYDFAGGKIGIKSEIALDWDFQRDKAVGKLTTANNHI